MKQSVAFLELSGQRSMNSEAGGMAFHSQTGQDQFVAGLIPEHGKTFVEFGALDGLLDSNSLYFERERGWTGLLIEANPSTFKLLERNRPSAKVCNAAVYDRNGTVEFEKIGGSLYGWSGIKDTIEPQHRQRIEDDVNWWRRRMIKVPCRTLDDILTEFGIHRIDYLSVDVEGAELAVLKAFPFQRYSIDIIGVEDNFGNPELDELIRKNGFYFLQTVGPDRFYRFS
jgi:FkbM family methyltransferase